MDFMVMRPDDKVLAKINMKPEVEELLCSWDFIIQNEYTDGVFEVRGGPLLEIIAVSIRPNIYPGDNDANSNWMITGTISAIPPSGTLSMLFRPPHYPLFISSFDSNGFAPLTGLEHGPFKSIFPSVHAEVCAKDMVRDRVLVDDPFVLDFEELKEFDQVQHTDINGAHGTIRLEYITYRAAVVTTVSVTVVHGGTDNHQVMVSGTIVGSCHYDISHICVEPPFDEPNSPCITLFNSPYHVPVTLGQDMQLSIPTMAVPSYSYLALHVNLNVAGLGSVNKIAIFKANHSSSREDFIEGPQGLLLKVEVKTYHECFFVSPMKDEVTGEKEAQASSAILPVQPMEAKVTGEKEAQASSAILPVQPMEAKVAVDEEVQPSNFFLYKYRQVRQFRGDTLMEVFTTFIAPRNEGPCKIHGRVEVLDSLRKNCCIYDHDDSNAEEISGNNRTISLEGPHDNSFIFEWNELHIKVDLKDGDHEFCKGIVCWSVIEICDPWLDNHMCSVIKGDLGYAAVYYGIFKNALQAKLRVFLTCNADTYVSGNIFGEQGNFDYSSHFERECYRSVIFSRGEEKAQALSMVDEVAMPLSPNCSSSERSKLLKESGIEMSLLKSLVVIPEDTCLVVDVDLVAKTSIEDGSNVEVSFKNRVEFEIGYQACWVKSSNNCQICVFVEWDTVRKLRRTRKQN